MKKKKISKKQCKILVDPVFISPDEIFDYFLDISDDLTMDNITNNEVVDRLFM